jgi:hypothetical protein
MPRAASIWLVTLVMLAGVLPGQAQLLPSDWDAFRATVADREETLRLERQLAGLILAEDENGVKALAASVSDAMGPMVDLLRTGDWAAASNPGGAEALAAAAADMGLFASAAEAQDAMDSIGSCDAAGILIRHIVLTVADGSQQAEPAGNRAVLAGSAALATYHLSMQRCEVIERVGARSRSERMLHGS